MYQIYNHATGNFLETLVILGNGFDIAHGIPSKYSDFHDYLMYQKKSNLLYQCDQYFSVEDFWANVEQSLGKIDYSHIVEEELSYLENASDRDEDNERNRFEAVLDDFSCRFLVELTDMVNEWELSVPVTTSTNSTGIANWGLQGLISGKPVPCTLSTKSTTTSM